MSTLLYGAETWPTTVANMKRLEATHRAHNKEKYFESYGDKITNMAVRRRTGMDQLEDIIWQRLLQWLEHIHRMEQGRIPKQTLNWSLAGKRRMGRPIMNWTNTIKRTWKASA